MSLPLRDSSPHNLQHDNPALYALRYQADHYLITLVLINVYRMLPHNDLARHSSIHFRAF